MVKNVNKGKAFETYVTMIISKSNTNKERESVCVCVCVCERAHWSQINNGVNIHQKRF